MLSSDSQNVGSFWKAIVNSFKILFDASRSYIMGDEFFFVLQFHRLDLFSLKGCPQVQ